MLLLRVISDSASHRLDKLLEFLPQGYNLRFHSILLLLAQRQLMLQLMDFPWAILAFIGRRWWRYVLGRGLLSIRLESGAKRRKRILSAAVSQPQILVLCLQILELMVHVLQSLEIEIPAREPAYNRVVRCQTGVV